MSCRRERLNIALNASPEPAHSAQGHNGDVMNPALPLHLGALHPYEQLLVALVAFGPFVVLIAVVYVVRRRDIAEEEGADRPVRRPRRRDDATA
jgi:hypothetical protein